MNNHIAPYLQITTRGFGVGGATVCVLVKPQSAFRGIVLILAAMVERLAIFVAVQPAGF